MWVYRLCSKRHIDTAFSGEGARLYGGRWNAPGTPAIYTSEHLSLAVLENLVHLEAAQLPRDRIALAIDVPDDAIEVFPTRQLPKNWRSRAAQKALVQVGQEWLRANKTLALKVPSAIVPSEHNLVLNPAHSRSAELSEKGRDPFSFDPRLFRFSTQALRRGHTGGS